MLSGWIMAAWIKADLRPDRIDPLPIHRRVEIVAQKPDKGQEWASYEGAKVRFLRDKQPDKSRSQTHESVGAQSSAQVLGGSASQGGQPGIPSTGNPIPQSGSQIPPQGTLPLGRYLVPTGGRDPLWVTPELDPVSGETKLQVEPAGGYVRFGGERYAFMDLTYQKLLQSDFSLSDVPALSIGLHQDLGRIGKLELMAEGWLSGSLLETQLERSVELGVGVRLRVALPF